MELRKILVCKEGCQTKPGRKDPMSLRRIAFALSRHFPSNLCIQPGLDHPGT